MSNKTTPEKKEPTTAKDRFTEGLDFYFEKGLMVLTAHFLLRRGYCCDNACRHCPYTKTKNNES